MANTETLKRVFLLGTTRIADPAPGLPLAEATKILAPIHPQFRWTEVLESDGKIVGDTLEFKLILPPNKVNG